ncbi:MAG: FHA domain-containing protein [Planctomycetales bacterium]|nr:FHA domain-containing protein [Planctomycetales bacterium]
MQKVVIKTVAGPHAGMSFWLSDQVIVVGRTSAADVVLENDKSMSSEHFRITANRDELQLQDLNSTNGTKVNDQLTKVCQLQHGDKIQAGQSVFQVICEAKPSTGNFDPDKSYRAPSQIELAPSPIASVPEKRIVPSRAMEVTCETCPSGLQRISGPVTEQTNVQDLIDMLLNKEHVFWMVDYSRLGERVPEQVTLKSSTLFPPRFESAAANLPVLLSNSEVQDRGELLRLGWGKDAVVVLTTELSKSELIVTLKQSIDPAGDEKPEAGIVGICWPSILAAVLYANPGECQSLLSDRRSVFMESDAGGGWQIFGGSAKIRQLENAGVLKVVEGQG